MPAKRELMHGIPGACPMLGMQFCCADQVRSFQLMHFRKELIQILDQFPEL